MKNTHRFIFLFIILLLIISTVYAEEITNPYIKRRIREYGVKIVPEENKFTMRSSPTDDADILYSHKKTDTGVEYSEFYVVDQVNINTPRGPNETQNIVPPGWHLVAKQTIASALIGWVKNDSFSLYKDVIAKERRAREREQDARKKEEEARAVALINTFEEKKNKHKLMHKSFKGFSFRGILIGISLEDQMFPCDEMGNVKEVCYKGGYIEGYYEIKNLVSLGFYSDTSVRVLDNKIESIVTTMPNDGADKLLNLLMKKYKKPKIFDKDVVQNRMGARFERFYAIWNIKNCKLTLTNRAHKIDEGIFIIESDKYMKHEKYQDKKREKNALDSI